MEGLKRVVKRFIEQVKQPNQTNLGFEIILVLRNGFLFCVFFKVELNIEFVQMKRDEAAFSPNDQQAIETFLQLEKRSKTAPYTQYYQNIVDKGLGTKVKK